MWLNPPAAAAELASEAEKIGNIMPRNSGYCRSNQLTSFERSDRSGSGGEQGRGFAVVADEVRAFVQSHTEAHRTKFKPQ